MDDSFDVFLSYKRESRTQVENIAGILRDLGLNVWFDTSLRAGEPWPSRILEVAEAANCIVVCWTQAASTSEWVQRELDVAVRRGVLVLARLDRHPLPGALESVHCADLADWNDELSNQDLRQLILGVDAFVPAPIGGKFAERVDGQNLEAVAELRRLLIAVARMRSTISYSDALARLASYYLSGRRTTWPTLFATLDAIAAQNRIAREPPLFGLVVSRATGIPGKGYFQKHCFLKSDQGSLAQSLHAEHLQRVYEHDWSD